LGSYSYIKEKDMEHKFLNVFVDGVWPRPERKIKVDGVEYDMDEYAKEHGIELPDSKSKQHKDIKKEVNTNADMGKQDHSGDTKIDGEGNSESSE
jgi:hypothetical protein